MSVSAAYAMQRRENKKEKAIKQARNEGQTHTSTRLMKERNERSGKEGKVRRQGM